jgi:hypothetical protein
VADRRYAEDEEAYVTGLAKSLGITIAHDSATAANLARFRLLAQIDAGNLPSVPVSILLKRAEVCHFAGTAAYHRIKTVTKRIDYGGPTASIGLMKGVRWRLGSITVQRVTTDLMTQLDTGTLYLTSARLLFDGAKKNTTLPLRTITNFTVFKDGLKVEKETGPDEYFLGGGDWELAGACLDAAIGRAR